MLSKAAIRQDLKLPGTIGQLLGESLRIFSVITGRKYKITGKNIITEIDNLMLELSMEEIPQTTAAVQKTKFAGYVILIIITIIAWLPWLNLLK
jgi:hypothetical protein